MEATESTGRDGGKTPPAGADPLTRQLLRLMAARCAQQAGPIELAVHEDLVDHDLDSIATMELISAWHRRGIEVGFPELMARPTPGHCRSPLDRRGIANAA
ncbi:phosphopantetheine-binding protein [Streptomyces jeddahensis]|uniref:Isochorismatase n=1 Tax=Streptomyces jeddahensis TaxID=1716141 RepID=A0A177HIV4_9ACTN|nr:phosphopantetheine-binding protein [Streptomyces jeddahensis]OAH10892.1 isochorismatase [Streptomyces jeddahensis]